MSVRVELAANPRWIAIERILLSKHFRNAGKQSAFLTYVAERALQGRVEEISEQQIGVHVFGRNSGYDAGSDNVVRSAARQLRQRLAMYYAEEGESEGIRVSIPTGTYVPTFLDRNVAAIAVEPQERIEAQDPTVMLPAAASGKTSTVLWLIAIGFVIVVGGLVWGAFYSRPEMSTFDRFWLTMLPADQRMLFVPTDSGIVMYQNYMHRNLTLPEYAEGSFATGWVGLNDKAQSRPELFFGLRRYTSIANLRLYAALVRLPTMDPKRIEIRFPRDLTTSDFKRGNVFLVGGPQGNPWVQLFGPALNFAIDTDDEKGIQTVVNKHPLATEKEPWIVRFREPGHDVFSLIAFVPNLDKAGYVLVISGSTMAGIDAAGDFLMTRETLGPILEQVKRGDGGFKPFEIVLKSESVRSGASGSKVVATRW